MAKKKVVEEEVDEQESLSGRLGEFGSAIMQIVDEKGLPKEKVIEVVEAALAAAYKKDYGKKSQVIRTKFDEVTKSASYFLVKEVVDESTREFVEEPEEGEEVEKKERQEAEFRRSTRLEEEPVETVEEDRLPRYNPERDLTVDEANLWKKGAKVGDIVEIKLPPHEDFGRVAAQTAKQVIIQRLREAERQTMYDEYKDREGEVVNGMVQRVEGRNVFVDLGRSIGILFPSEQVEGESYRTGQHIKVLIARVESDPKGPGVVLSRSHPNMVRHLFSLEVPEIFAGTVEIKAIAREAGSRTKIAVSANQEGIDPIGSCVGQKGTRVQAVIDELGGEKIDIIEWNEKFEKFVVAAMSPAKVLSVTVTDDETNKRAKVVVPDDQLSLAIGKRGQNVRLAAKLASCRIDVISATEAGVVVKPEESDADADTDMPASTDAVSAMETEPVIDAVPEVKAVKDDAEKKAE